MSRFFIVAGIVILVVGVSNFVFIAFILIDADLIVIVTPLQTSLSSLLSSSSLPLPPTAVCGSEGGTGA